ncbi:MAG: hypothetical protein MMC33_009702 [Icmadophila ericetorum]|nr:hypothetical protein [Icmadophila ericetorum]
MQIAWEDQGWNESFQQPSTATMYYNYRVPIDNERKSQHQNEVLQASQADLERSAAESCQRKKEIRKMAAFLIFSFLILIFNIAFLGAFAKGRDLLTPVTLFQGSCTESAKLSFWIHLLINGLSSVLLMGSSIGFQTAQLVRGWTDQYGSIYGYASGGIALLVVLGFSSLPIHLFYNSAVYQTIGTNSFYLAIVGETFFSSGPATPPTIFSDSDFDPVYENMRANGSNWDKMNNLDCIETYGNKLLTDHGNLILVTSNSSSASLYLALYIDWNQQDPIYAWMCSPLGSDFGIPIDQPANCTLSSLESGAANWTILSQGGGSGLNPRSEISRYPVEYCLSEPISSQY